MEAKFNSLRHLVTNLWSCREGGEGDKPFELMFDCNEEIKYKFPDGCAFDEFALIGGELWLTDYNIDECNPSYVTQVTLSFFPTIMGWNINKFDQNGCSSVLEKDWFTYSKWEYVGYVTTFKFFDCHLGDELKNLVGKEQAESIIIDLDEGIINVDGIVRPIYIVPK